ncbi:sulfatase modifying factor 1 (C-alpha-formyglycine- generating enzyme 1) [Gordonia terrae]|uniref:Sulfatase modifying factor 1 (C-alpha-formyglycine-generating enzyme 1) n=1 Tax=Gordonia terrae TaxID=2055 RepID=A0A2I1RCZ5_9ACTN|nr:sulfatase modifying factor 1 (C-alpha-formyglycine- generating enzyme 1) [Gordonia terrae]
MSCCHPGGPVRDGADESPTVEQNGILGSGPHLVETVTVPAGVFDMGDAFGEGYRTDGETPVHEVELNAFSIDTTAVTNATFASFVAATGHRTDAETFGGSAVFHTYATAPGRPVPGTPWWLAVDGASWRHPAGPGSTLDGLADHPVVHVSHRDAQAYCDWAGRALPTEAQWEYAARGGRRGARYPWGDEPPTADDPRCTIFRGDFPNEPTGPVGTTPVRTFEPNGHGLYQCAGNVWEWCADRFSARYYRVSDRTDPSGPARGSARVLRGGSHLCHDSYCHRYRVAARSHNTPESTASNIGFRTVGPRDTRREPISTAVS